MTRDPGRGDDDPRPVPGPTSLVGCFFSGHRRSPLPAEGDKASESARDLRLGLGSPAAVHHGYGHHHRISPGMFSECVRRYRLARPGPGRRGLGGSDLNPHPLMLGDPEPPNGGSGHLWAAPTCPEPGPVTAAGQLP